MNLLTLSSFRRQFARACLVAPIVTGLSLALIDGVEAQQNDALRDCLALGGNEDEIHNCLDNFLDVMDDNMRDLNKYTRRVLDGSPRDAFNASQEAFVAFRKENCLWYLRITEPRSVAEQVAKNCLITMSQQRLSELQQLIAGVSDSTITMRGHLVDAGSRRLFQPCRADRRYQVAGDAATLAAVRQYLQTRDASGSPLQVVVQGILDENAEIDTNLAGLLRIRSFSEIGEADDEVCPPPEVPDLDSEAVQPSEDTSEAEGDSLDDADEPDGADPTDDAGDLAVPTEEPLTAYFGGWQVDCGAEGRSRICMLATALQLRDGPMEIGNRQPQLRLRRLAQGDTMVILSFPDREVDSPAKFIWQVDSIVIGDIVGSVIRVDEQGTRQLVDDLGYVERELVPLFKRGASMQVEVLDDIDDPRGEAFEATLIGLTRAIEFADEYIQ